MRRRTSGGFTLVELMMALALSLVVAGTIHRVLVGQLQLFVAQQEQIALQTNLRTALLFLGGEFREIASGGTSDDIVAMAGDSITYRAMRAAGLACQVSPAELRLRATPLSGFRQPQPGRDSVLLFVEGDTARSTDDTWLVLPLSSKTSGSCGARPAIALGVSPPFDTSATTGTPLARIRLAAPVRTFEVMQVKLYQSGGQYWLGARSVSAGEAIQPVAGPLSPNGLTLTYFDSAGATTGVPRRVRKIRIVVRGVTARSVRTAHAAGQLAPVPDSLSTEVTLRNAPGR